MYGLVAWTQMIHTFPTDYHRTMDNDRMNPNPRLPENLLVHAGAIVDAHGISSPGAVLLKGGKIVASGSPQEVGEVSGIPHSLCPDAVIMPGLVNAHAHLDLTSIGPVDADEGFSKWLDQIRIRRPKDSADITSAVEAGVKASLAGGSVGIGDISGSQSWVPFEALSRSSLLGTSWIEVFGIANREQSGIEAVEAVIAKAKATPGGRIRPGISPHAPTSCGLEVYRRAANSGLPVATHLAESIEELDFTRCARGPMKDLLVDLDIWGDGIPAYGDHPIDLFSDIFSCGSWTLAHINYPSLASESDEERKRRIAIISKWNAVVAYCPRASAFFGHPHNHESPHPWREFLAAGIPLALGTDGMPCLDTPHQLSILDEMRWLAKNDGAHWRELLPMATVNGGASVGISPELLDLRPGPVAGLICVQGEGDDPVSDALSRDESPRWICDAVDY